MSQILTSGSGGGGGGTVTAITAATGITLTPNPIIGAGTVGLTIPVVVTSGGTGLTTATTAYAPICAGTTATGAFQVASTGLATAGFVLTSNGNAALPSFQAAGGGPGTNIFSAYVSAQQNNVTGNAVQYTIIFDSVTSNPGGNYNVATGVFTAPVTGNYMFTTMVSLNNFDGSETRAIFDLTTTTTDYRFFDVSPIPGPGIELIYSGSTLTRMTAGDTAYVFIRIFSGAQTVGVEGGALPGRTYTTFNGYYVSA
jgi:hypothetical protein